MYRSISVDRSEERSSSNLSSILFSSRRKRRSDGTEDRLPSKFELDRAPRCGPGPPRITTAIKTLAPSRKRHRCLARKKVPERIPLYKSTLSPSIDIQLYAVYTRNNPNMATMVSTRSSSCRSQLVVVVQPRDYEPQRVQTTVALATIRSVYHLSSSRGVANRLLPRKSRCR